MAERPGFFPRAIVRSFIRRQVRYGLPVAEIIDAALDEFVGAVETGSLTEGAIRRITTQESARQTAVDRIHAKDLRSRTNMHAIVGCGAGETVYARITLSYIDPRTETRRNFGHTVPLDNQGRMMDILNSALKEIISTAMQYHYEIPNITSSMTSGQNYYRIEYVECR